MSMLGEAPAPVVHINGKDCIYFGGNNYLGLANHPAVMDTAIQAIRQFGVNIAASRHTTGTTTLHVKLEAALAAFKGREEAVTFASGYLGNAILMQALRDQYVRILIDEAAHPSLSGGIPRDIRNVDLFRHCDVQHLEELLQTHTQGKTLILTDGVFALTGEIAPVDAYYRLAMKYDALILTDDAHATGILGENGRGTPEYFQLDGSKGLFQTETMSKAVGGYGGFIAGDASLVHRIRDHSPVYQASTALPPPMAAAGLAGVQWICENKQSRHLLVKNAVRLKNEIKTLGFQTYNFPTPIIPVIFSTEESGRRLAEYLLKNGIWVPFMNYPVKQAGYLLRIALSVHHTESHIDRLLTLLGGWKRKEKYAGNL
jgi:7-keto-8-aminopelargonate synthetase-like enzyme